MPEVFVSLGSNQNREHNIRSAVRAIRGHFGDLTCSRVYRNKAVGFEGDDFLNMVLSFESDDSPQAIQAVFRNIEADHGRTRREAKFSPRTLDIDMILYGDWVMQEDKLRLPREDITRYAFVLLPLSEISPQGMHPVLGESYADMWQQFDGDKQLQAVDIQLDR